MFGMFACPSGANVSWSRAPPPKVTTTTFLSLATRAARNGDRERALPNVSPAARRNSRRLEENRRLISYGLNPRWVTTFIHYVREISLACVVFVNTFRPTARRCQSDPNGSTLLRKPQRHSFGRLIDAQNLIGLHVMKNLPDSTGPADIDLLHGLLNTESEMYPFVP